jgi:hypothetical protein
VKALLMVALGVTALQAQTPQNPSPMVEHARAHQRLAKEPAPAGRREKLDVGTLFLPAGLKSGAPILFFFHGDTWVPEIAAAQNHTAAVSVQAGTGSAVYARLFEEPQRFLQLLAEAESKAGMKFGRVMIGGWSAGCGAVRQIIKTPASYERVNGALLIDGIHDDYVDGKPGPLESKLAAENLEVWMPLLHDAVAGKKRVIITHSEIFPGTYASTTETADALLKMLGVTQRAVLKWGPMGLQQLSEASSGRFLLMGFAGNSAPDHVDQLHSLPVFLKWLR